MLRVIAEVEPRIVKQCRYHYCCIYKNYRGRVMEDGKKFLHRFPADQKRSQMRGEKSF